MTESGRTPFVAGNWKMNTDRAGAIALIEGLKPLAMELTGSVELGVCPPFVYLDAARGALEGSAIALGAQDVYHAANGAFTGEVSLSMLADLGVRHVLTGHSERRHVIGEDDGLVASKTRATLSAGIGCILCIGETLEQRKAGETDEVNRRQVLTALDGIPRADLDKLTIAYEPVWAIGTGLAATPDDAQDAHAKIRALIAETVDGALASSIRILYGGSMKPANASELLAQPDIDGGLIGGASLKAPDFIGIARAASTVAA